MLEPRCGESPQVRYLRGGRRSDAPPLPDRRGVKRDAFWLGYKLHISETCDDAPPCDCAAAGGGHDRDCARTTFPNLITNAAATDATVPDIQMTGVIHGELAGRDLAPGRHYLDSGYLSAAVVVAALRTRGIALIGPLLADTSAQARAGHGYARDGARRKSPVVLSDFPRLADR